VQVEPDSGLDLIWVSAQALIFDIVTAEGLKESARTRSSQRVRCGDRVSSG
jgi:hypothetical protein